MGKINRVLQPEDDEVFDNTQVEIEMTTTDQMSTQFPEDEQDVTNQDINDAKIDPVLQPENGDVLDEKIIDTFKSKHSETKSIEAASKNGTTDDEMKDDPQDMQEDNYA